MMYVLASFISSKTNAFFQGFISFTFADKFNVKYFCLNRKKLKYLYYIIYK